MAATRCRLANIWFPFNWVPLREGTPNPCCPHCCGDTFPFNWVPLREGTCQRSRRQPTAALKCFHSIGFPCERGRIRIYADWTAVRLEFPFNWVPLREGTRRFAFRLSSRCVRQFPFNWVPLREGTATDPSAGTTTPYSSFHSIGFPCERGPPLAVGISSGVCIVFPFNWVPLREGTVQSAEWTPPKNGFPFNWVPLREGTG